MWCGVEHHPQKTGREADAQHKDRTCFLLVGPSPRRLVEGCISNQFTPGSTPTTFPFVISSLHTFANGEAEASGDERMQECPDEEGSRKSMMREGMMMGIATNVGKKGGGDSGGEAEEMLWCQSA
ncbi:hypothetical protein R1sor_015312 [Riccia sorocarpa]|uniref:Uncharacterized protein n=1 Tax=Riccia sorocarpa TaxID=122646 RepID=A0ABD3HCC8_9MARC